MPSNKTKKHLEQILSLTFIAPLLIGGVVMGIVAIVVIAVLGWDAVTKPIEYIYENGFWETVSPTVIFYLELGIDLALYAIIRSLIMNERSPFTKPNTRSFIIKYYAIATVASLILSAAVAYGQRNNDGAIPVKDGINHFLLIAPALIYGAYKGLNDTWDQDMIDHMNQASGSRYDY